MTRRNRILIAAALAAVAAGGGFWLEQEVRERRRAEGARQAVAAAELARRGRALAAEGHGPEALPLLERAVFVLRGVEGAKPSTGYAALLVDLASLRAAQGDPAQRAAAVGLLGEAWSAPGLPGPLRARIAADLGALSVLGGDLKGAESWYVRAASLAPDDATVSARLRLLRSPAASGRPTAPPPSVTPGQTQPTGR